MIVKSHYSLGGKIVVFVEGDVYAIRVRDAVQDVVFNDYKGKFSEVVIINEQNRSVTLSGK